MTKARTLADMISDGVIGTTELADDVITPVKLDETGNYTVAQLSVDGIAQIRGVTVKDSSGTTKGYVQGDGDGLLIASDGSNNITFDVNAVERVRIDASGNLMIGGTNGNPIGNHVSQIIANGANGLGVHRDGGVPFKAGTDSDRNIIEVYRQGALIGALGVADSDNLIVSSTATNHGGFKFSDTTVTPYVNATNSDNEMDIGAAANRFKDLHLGGNIYVDADNTDSGHKLQIGEYNTNSANQSEGETKLIHVDDSYVMRVARRHGSGNIASTGWYNVAKIPPFGTHGKVTVSLGGDFTADVIVVEWISSHNTALGNSLAEPQVTAKATFANVTAPRVTNTRVARDATTGTYYVQVYVGSGVNNNTNGKSVLELHLGEYVETNNSNIEAMFSLYTGSPSHYFECPIITNGSNRLGRHTTPEQPYFLASMSSNLVVGRTVGYFTLPFNQTRHNVGGHFNTSTYTFTAPVSGFYEFAIHVETNSNSVWDTNTWVYTGNLYKNGSALTGNDNWGNTGRHNSWSYTYIDYFAAGDTAQVRGYNPGSYLEFGGDSGSSTSTNNCRFSGRLLT